MSIHRFQIRVEDSVLIDLQERLDKSRFTDASLAGAWADGTDPGYLREFCRSWRHDFDWKKQEAHLNSFEQNRAEIDGFGIHFLRAKGRGSNPIPLLLLHGWPDSFVRFLKLIPLLTDPSAHGLGDGPCFDVIVPSLPGFGFSDKPRRQGFTFEIAALFQKLMVEELGFRRYAVHGGDWGAIFAEDLARQYPSSLYGIHLTDVPAYHLFQPLADLSSAELDYVKGAMTLKQREGAYVAIQNTRPRSLSPGLNDSPVGLAAWFLEKFRAWSDCGGVIENSFSRDELLTNLTLYWATETVDSSIQPYYDLANAGDKLKAWSARVEVPAALALFPKDPSPPPRVWAERFFRVHRWEEMPRGGHFAAMEEPKLLATDIQAAFLGFTSRAE